MGILDSLRKFADKKRDEYRESEKANAETRTKENAVYKESFAQARLKQLKVKARGDARSSVFGVKGTKAGGNAFERINSSGIFGGGFAPVASKKGHGGAKAHKTVSYEKHGKYYKKVVHQVAGGARAVPGAQSRMINPDSIDYNNMGAASLFNKKNRYI